MLAQKRKGYLSTGKEYQSKNLAKYLLRLNAMAAYMLVFIGKGLNIFAKHYTDLALSLRDDWHCMYCVCVWKPRFVPI